jgi:hypothetical protein
MKSRRQVLAFGALLALLFSLPATAGENVLTGAASPQNAGELPPLSDCSANVDPDTGAPVVVAVKPYSATSPMFFEYCGGSNWPDIGTLSTWTHQLFIDNGSAIVGTNVTCAAVTGGLACRGIIPEPGVNALRPAGLHTIAVSTKFPPVSGVAMESPRSGSFQVSSSPGCSYAAPSAGPNPTTLETRPIGETMQGFNPIGASGTNSGQGARIALLESWGWRVQWQFVDGSVRADRTDRIFLIAKCIGVPQ